MQILKKIEGVKTKIGAALILAAPVIAQQNPAWGGAALVAGKIIAGVGLADFLARVLYTQKTGA